MIASINAIRTALAILKIEEAEAELHAACIRLKNGDPVKADALHRFAHDVMQVRVMLEEQIKQRQAPQESL